MVMKRWIFFLQAFTLLWVIGLAGNLQAAAPKYYYFTTGELGSEAVAINDKNQAVVNFNDRACLWTLNEGLLDLGDPADYLDSGNKSVGYAINHAGQIVGEYYIDADTSHAFIWDPQTKVMTDLTPLSSGVRNIACSINSSGKVVGGAIDPDNATSPWTWTQAGGLQPLDLQGGFPFKIKDDGRMVGQKDNHAWLWLASGAGQDLGTLASPYNGVASASDINKSGRVAGWAMMANLPSDSASHALSWTKKGGLQDLGTVDNTAGYSRAFSISDQNYLVGWSDFNNTFSTVGCLWIPSGAKFKKFNLDTLVINKPEGVTIGDARDINNKGVIVGRGNGDPADTAAYMLVPPGPNVFTPRFNYSESWTEKVGKINDPGEEPWYDVFPAGKFQITVILPAFLLDINDIGADTEFSVEFGAYADSFYPGEDPKYTAGKQAAQITRYLVPDAKKLPYLKTTLTWNQKTVTIAISGVEPNDYLSPPTADDYMGFPGPFQDAKEAVVSINTPDPGFTQTFLVNLTGKNKMKHVVKAGNEYDLNNISLKGSASGF
jgi:probable HAF family extracellular repeat protein